MHKHTTHTPNGTILLEVKRSRIENEKESKENRGKIVQNGVIFESNAVIKSDVQIQSRVQEICEMFFFLSLFPLSITMENWPAIANRT